MALRPVLVPVPHRKNFNKYKMTEEQIMMLKKEMYNPPIHNTNPINLDIEAEIAARTKKSKWLIEFEAICFQKKNEKPIRWFQFWRHWY